MTVPHFGGTVAHFYTQPATTPHHLGDGPNEPRPVDIASAELTGLRWHTFRPVYVSRTILPLATLSPWGNYHGLKRRIGKQNELDDDACVCVSSRTFALALALSWCPGRARMHALHSHVCAILMLVVANSDVSAREPGFVHAVTATPQPPAINSESPHAQLHIVRCFRMKQTCSSA